MISGSGSQGFRQRRTAKVLSGFLALLMLGVWGVAGTATVASAATQTLSAPTGLAPDNNVSAGPNPTLTWSAVSGASYYRVTYPNTQGTAVTSTVYAASYAPTVDFPVGSINWSVTAYDQTGNFSAASNATFTNNSANGPVLNCPSSPVNFPVQAPTFTWNAVNGVETYTLQVSTSSTFVPASTVTYSTQATSFTLTKGVPDSQQYFAKISGTSAGGLNTPSSNSCSYSVVWSAGTTGQNDAIPVLKSPADHSTVRDIQLKWAPLSGAARYEVQISPNGDWTNNLLYDVVTDSSAWSPAKTLNNGSYFWRVRGIDNQGNFSRWSDYPSTSAGDAWEFNVSPLSAPTLVFPVDNTTVPNPDLRFSWNPVPGAGAYQVQWSSNSSFSYGNQGDAQSHTCFTTHTDWSPYTAESPPGASAGPGGNDGCRANNKFQSPNFVDGTTIFWHVRAIDDYTQGELADPWTTSQFTLTNRPPTNGAFISVWSNQGKFFFNSAAPALQSPSSGSTVSVPTMTWSRVSGAMYYQVLLTTDSWGWNGSVCTAPTGNGSGRTVKTSALSYTPSLVNSPRITDHKQCPINVSWTVQSVDYNSRKSAVPTPHAFTWSGYSTPTSATLTPTSTTPADNATVQGIPTFSWNPVTGADRYQVWWFDNPAGDIYTTLSDYNPGSPQPDPITESFTPVQPLPVETGAWQIVAFNSAGKMVASSPKRDLTVAGPDAVAPTSFTTRSQNGSAVTCTSGCTVPSTPLITWATNPSVSYYRVFIAQDPNFTNIVRIYDTDQNNIRPVEALLDNQAGQSYYVFVQGAKANWWTGANSTGTIYGEYGSQVIASNVSSFHKQSTPVTGLKTLSPTSTTTVNSTSACDDGTSLASGSDVPTFCWNASSTSPYASGDVGAMQYHIQVSTTPDFSKIIDQAWVDQPTYTPYVWPQSSGAGYSPGSTINPPSSQSIRDITYPDGPIYWRVQAVDSTGNGLTYSSIASYTKSSNAIVPTGPSNGATVGGTPSLTWSSKTFAAQYQVQVAKNGDLNFSQPNTLFSQNTDLTAITPSANGNPLNGTSLPAGTYAWHVRGIDAGGNSGAWSPVRTFTVQPTAPSLLTPTNTQTFAQSSGLSFSWTPVNGAVSYRIYVSTNNPPTSSPAVAVTTVSNAWSMDRNLANGTWYWAVQALDSGNQVLSSSAPYSFTFNGSRPTATNLTATPAKPAVNLSWSVTTNPVAGPITKSVITQYQGSTVIATKTLMGAGTTYMFSPVSPGINYGFTVTPYDALGAAIESNQVRVTVPPNTATQSYVYATYNDFLGRNPSASELSSKTYDLDHGTTKANYLASLANSPQWVSAIVTGFYWNTLGRAPDQGGLDFWTQRIRSGEWTVAKAASAFYSAPEYFLYIHAGPTDYTTWIKDLYPKLLGRTPDSGGVTYWAAQAQKIGPGQVAYSFYQSEESRKARVVNLYVALLGRNPLTSTPPDTAGVAYWAGRITNEGDIALAVNLAASPEYYAKAHVDYP